MARKKGHKRREAKREIELSETCREVSGSRYFANVAVVASKQGGNIVVWKREKTGIRLTGDRKGILIQKLESLQELVFRKNSALF